MFFNEKNIFYCPHTTFIGVSHSVYGVAVLVDFSNDKNLIKACTHQTKRNTSQENQLE